MTVRNFARNAAIGAFCGLALSACQRGEARLIPPPLPKVEFITIQASRIPLTETLSGRTEAYAVAEIRPQVSGQLDDRLFTEGSEVLAGQPLFQIERAPFQAAYDGASAILQNAQDNLALADARAKRYAELYKVSAISKQDYDIAQAGYKQAATAVAQQKASVENAALNLDHTLIRSPVSGYIGRSPITRGALVTAYQPAPLAIVQTLNPIYVDLGVSSSLLTTLKEKLAKDKKVSGAPEAPHVRLTFEDGSSYPLEGKLPFTNVTFDKDEGKIELRAIFPNPKLALGPGMKVSVIYTDGIDDNAILVPKTAIRPGADGAPTALVLDEKNIVRARVVTVGGSVREAARITTGLQPGDRLIVRAPGNIVPGTRARGHAVTAPSS